MSTRWTDTSTLTEPLSFPKHSRETESKGRDIKNLPRILFLPLIISFHPPTTPNHQPCGLACHCWVSHSPSEGPPDNVSPPFSSSRGESAISSERKGVTSRLTWLYGWGQGQVSSRDWPERRGPGPGRAPRSARTHLTLSLSSSARPETLWRSAAHLPGHLALGRGWRYPLQEPLSSGQWLMKPAWWQVLMSSPRLV